MRQIFTGEPLVEFNGSLADFVRDLDQLWHGYPRQRPPADDLWWDSQEAVDECSRLLDQLNALAPSEHSFRGHPLAPNCWGYWPLTDLETLA